ncbi:MAG: membrane protease YdiL (CAAX protease family) [Akkermansiaceae bacterium]
MAEHKLLGDILLMTLVSFFGLALPGYALMRKLNPESDWNRGGSVSTSVIQVLDLVIMGLYIMLFSFGWWNMGEKIANPEALKMSAGAVLEASFAMIFLTSLVPAVLFWRANLAEFFGLRWEKWQSIFWIMPAFVFGMMVLGALLVASGWQDWVTDTYGSKPQEAVTLLRETKDVGLLVAIAVSAVIVAPIVEEVMFRGYLYPVVKRYSDRWFAALFTGVLFGVIHYNFMSLPMLAFMGVVLVVLYEVTGSLWVTIGCHAAFNGTSIGVMLFARFYELPPAP